MKRLGRRNRRRKRSSRWMQSRRATRQKQTVDKKKDDRGRATLRRRSEGEREQSTNNASGRVVRLVPFQESAAHPFRASLVYEEPGAWTSPVDSRAAKSNHQDDSPAFARQDTKGNTSALPSASASWSAQSARAARDRPPACPRRFNRWHPGGQHLHNGGPSSLIYDAISPSARHADPRCRHGDMHNISCQFWHRPDAHECMKSAVLVRAKARPGNNRLASWPCAALACISKQSSAGTPNTCAGRDACLSIRRYSSEATSASTMRSIVRRTRVQINQPLLRTA